MTLADYVNEHPLWTLIFLCIIGGSVSSMRRNVTVKCGCRAKEKE